MSEALAIFSFGGLEVNGMATPRHGRFVFEVADDNSLRQVATLVDDDDALHLFESRINVVLSVPGRGEEKRRIILEIDGVEHGLELEHIPSGRKGGHSATARIHYGGETQAIVYAMPGEENHSRTLACDRVLLVHRKR